MNALEIYRKDKGLNQSEMGEKIGVTNAAISHYESGRRIPQLEKRKFISRVTHGAVPVDSWGIKNENE